VDVAMKDNDFVVRATMPGVRPEDMQANVQGDRLTLQAESQNEQERKDEQCVVRERYATVFYRVLPCSTVFCRVLPCADTPLAGEYWSGRHALRSRFADADLA
jgi:hypothetical protein